MSPNLYSIQVEKVKLICVRHAFVACLHVDYKTEVIISAPKYVALWREYRRFTL